MEKDIIKEFNNKIEKALEDINCFGYNAEEFIVKCIDNGLEIVSLSAVSQAKEEGRKQGVEAFIKKETEYWKNVFDTRPYDRDLESDTIAQNFARIEIERLKKLIN
jgi:hypothetical protein